MLTFDCSDGWFTFTVMIDPKVVFKEIRTQAGTDGGFTAHWAVPAHMAYLDGHFPGLPIFPAVGIVDATLYALRIHLNTPSLELTGIPTAKFLSPVTPDNNVILEFHALDHSNWQCNWKEEGSQKLLADLRLSCRLS